MQQHHVQSVELVGSTIPELVALGLEWWVATCVCGWHTQRFWYKEQAMFFLKHHVKGHAGVEARKRRKLNSAATVG